MSNASQEGFSAEERAAMKERAKEVRPKRKGKTTPEDDANEVLAKIDEMTGSDRAIAERLHELVAENTPELLPKTWYGMPAYAKDGKIVVFFQGAEKFKSRYATIGFSDAAAIDDGTMWPAAYAVTELTASAEKTIVALIKKAVS